MIENQGGNEKERQKGEKKERVCVNQSFQSWEINK